MPDTATHAGLVLQTPRLIVRPLRLEDAPDVQRFASDWDVARFTSSIPHPYPDGAAEAWIRGQVEDFDNTFGIELRAGALFVGAIGFEHNSEKREIVFGYWIGKPHWGNGYATEAVRALVDHAFTALGAERVLASVMPENRASVRVQEKVGMVYCGVAQEP